jgi:four helix bundle protein
MQKHTNRPDPLREKTLNLAIRIVKLNQHLTQKKYEYVISKQILRCGTNPGAMIREAANAESPLDFIHKLSVAQKEAGETLYWLGLLFKTDYLSSAEYQSMQTDTEEIMRLIRSSILTKKKNLAVKTISAIAVLSLILLTV